MSAPSAMDVEPTRSANRTETRRRSIAVGDWPTSRVAATSGRPSPGRGSPQTPQNRSPGSLTAAHDGHTTPSSTPHDRQNRRSARLSVPQARQVAGPSVTVATAYRLWKHVGAPAAQWPRGPVPTSAATLAAGPGAAGPLPIQVNRVPLLALGS